MKNDSLIFILDAVILEHFKGGSLKDVVSKVLSNHYGCLLLKFSDKRDAEEFILQVNFFVFMCER